VIDPSDRSRFGRERVAFMATQCFAGFVKTDDWTSLVIWFVVEGENVLHVVDEVSVLLGRYLPITGEMRF
jgi:hypothetical protein